jgi:hypothetical protein
MLQFEEDVTAVPVTGWLEHLIEAFPEEAAGTGGPPVE